MSCFHLAIPANDIQASEEFYKTLGCKIGRKSNNFCIVKFYGHQIVLHHTYEPLDPKPEMYPRHFGLIIDDEDDFNELYRLIPDRETIWQECFHRYIDKPEEHKTFFLKDPGHNLIEFKWYKNKEKIFG